MRPVAKLNAGDFIEIERSTGVRERVQIKASYDDYGDAKPALVANLGSYCSYCERFIRYESIHVEHIEPKNLTKQKGQKYYEHDWKNFLLSCPICNSCKGDTHYLPEQLILPNKDDSYKAFLYFKGGGIEVNPVAEDDVRERANNTLSLIKLTRKGNECTGADFRWKERLEAWNTAEDFLTYYTKGKANLSCIISYVKKTGMWSVWYTVFQEVDAVKKSLIESFPGTAKQYFLIGEEEYER